MNVSPEDAEPESSIENLTERETNRLHFQPFQQLYVFDVSHFSAAGVHRLITDAVPQRRREEEGEKEEKRQVLSRGENEVCLSSRRPSEADTVN